MTRVARWVSIVKQELLTFTENQSAPSVVCGVCVATFLVSYVAFVHHCLSFRLFSFGYRIAYLYFDLQLMMTPF